MSRERLEELRWPDVGRVGDKGMGEVWRRLDSLYLPELGSNLVAALSSLDVHDLPHCKAFLWVKREGEGPCSLETCCLRRGRGDKVGDTWSRTSHEKGMRVWSEAGVAFGALGGFA